MTVITKIYNFLCLYIYNCVTVCDDYSDNKFEYTNISGGKCTMRNSGKSGHCTSVKQCNTRLPSINSSDYTICGYDCCNELICCPDPDPGFNMKSGQCN